MGEAGPEAVIPLSDKSSTSAIGNAILDGLNLGESVTTVGDLLRVAGNNGMVSPSSTGGNNNETNRLLKELIAAVKSNGDVTVELGDEKFMRGLRKASRATTKSGRNVF